MAWRSGERTLRAYEHVQRAESFARGMEAIHRAMRRREREALESHDTIKDTPQTAELDQDLTFVLGDDNDD
jgi:hypothetical protein